MDIKHKEITNKIIAIIGYLMVFMPLLLIIFKELLISHNQILMIIISGLLLQIIGERKNLFVDKNLSVIGSFILMEIGMVLLLVVFCLSLNQLNSLELLQENIEIAGIFITIMGFLSLLKAFDRLET